MRIFKRMRKYYTAGILVGVAAVIGMALMADKVEAARKKRIVGTRMVVAGCKHLAGGASMDEAKQKVLEAWSDDERRQLGLPEKQKRSRKRPPRRSKAGA